jgi:prepilin-type N-terminal cleavage/methylation domain-containing protein
MRRGFTLIELSVVLTVMTLVVTVTVPVYRTRVARAYTDEARTLLSAIAHAELRYHRDHAVFLACGGAPVAPALPAPFPGELPCWKALGVQVDGPTRYAYGVALAEPDSFTAVARADLDGNGIASTFTLDGRTLQLTIENELE